MKNQRLIIPLLLGILLFITAGCKKDDDAVKPTITTEQVTAITTTTATCSGNITNDGGAPVTACGMVWGTTENPTVDNNTGITTDGTGTGSYTSNLTGLTPNTTHYVRAYATNSTGTGYGNQQTFTTLDGVIDADGNVYRVITIGTQTWMAENLKTTHYNDGTEIPNITDSNEWVALTSGAYCWYNNDETTYKDTYGALYNWYAVNTGKLAPTGWHVPTDAEWRVLIDYLGDEREVSGKLKESGITHWANPNFAATNETGFTALPGGYREYQYGAFDGIGNTGFWWSATESVNNSAWYRAMFAVSSIVTTPNYFKGNGFSVRCIRD
ncbi:fibrobacter succinogenes major paralogous domain-containing protein [Maribellus sp. YY47]|uniref:fibrobacter succinogenes major paralogous domain-containing protein n=1 Tax=Maribellus sp. YY47 TaxID=2929486 RepID=UPI00200158CC|nr:fibrobacter succinogenes major paralogous domain-containing protein [Maribellus sp. YY47]MCK3682627.1 fibrobacter succinogenes major paralogous domain-containing protein [Maribellus sp. YY47]